MKFLERTDYILVKDIDKDWYLVKNKGFIKSPVIWICKKCESPVCSEHERPRKVLELKRFYNIMAGNDEYISVPVEHMH